MTRFVQVLHMRSVPKAYAAIYRARGMNIPIMSSGKSFGALIPLRLRALHKAWANVNGYYWMPCILCGTEYGGHEITDTIPDPIEGEGRGIVICPFCTIRRNRGTT